MKYCEMSVVIMLNKNQDQNKIIYFHKAHINQHKWFFSTNIFKLKKQLQNVLSELNTEISKTFLIVSKAVSTLQTKSLINYNLGVFSKSIIDFYFFLHSATLLCMWGISKWEACRNKSDIVLNYLIPHQYEAFDLLVHAIWVNLQLGSSKLCKSYLFFRNYITKKSSWSYFCMNHGTNSYRWWKSCAKPGTSDNNSTSTTISKFFIILFWRSFNIMGMLTLLFLKLDQRTE